MNWAHFVRSISRSLIRLRLNGKRLCEADHLTEAGGLMERGGRKCLVKTWITPYEKARIASNAKACGMSMSGYVRTLLSGSNPISKSGLGDLQEIFKLHGDLGRLGGLLKMLLTNDERLNDIGRDMATVTIDNVLIDIRVTQDHLKQAVAKALGKGADSSDEDGIDSKEA